MIDDDLPYIKDNLLYIPKSILKEQYFIPTKEKCKRKEEEEEKNNNENINIEEEIENKSNNENINIEEEIENKSNNENINIEEEIENMEYIDFIVEDEGNPISVRYDENMTVENFMKDFLKKHTNYV